MPQPVQRPLSDYFLAAAVDSAAATLFGYCSFFWARSAFGYSDDWNLRMGAIQGVAAVVCPLWAGKMADRLGYDRILRYCLPAAALLLLIAMPLTWRWTPVVFSTLFAAAIITTWPALEAAVMHAPGRQSIPARLGPYNVIWSSFGAVGFFLSGLVYQWRPSGIFWVPALLLLGMWGWLNFRPAPRPVEGNRAAMHFEHAGGRVPAARKRKFLDLALLGNALAYFMLSSFMALAPHLGERFGLSAAHAIWLSCSLLFARSAAFWLFWKWEGWHYHPHWGRLALWLAPLCLAVVFFSTSLPLVGLALVGLGLAIGLTYYGSIYYSLDYGDNKGEGGGRHEAALGLGILGGPLIGAIATYLLGGVTGGKAAIVGLALLITATGAWWINRRTLSRRDPHH